MKAVLMRVRRASVTIDERETRSIGRGFLILLAVTHDDTEAQAVKLADKLCSLRLLKTPTARSTSRSTRSAARS